MRTLLCLCAVACVPAGAPLPGVWTYTDGGVTSSTCGTDLYQDPDASFLLGHVTATGFEIDDGSGEPFDCTIDGDAFTCPERAAEIVPIEGTGIELSYVVSIAGTVVDATHLEGEQTFAIDCSGALCGIGAAVIGAEVPCAYTVAFTANL